MNLRELASEITRREGKRINCSVGQVSEIIALVADALYADSTIANRMWRAGERRAKAKAYAKTRLKKAARK